MSNPNDPLDREEMRKLRKRIQDEVGDLTWEDLLEASPSALTSEQRKVIVEVARTIEKRFQE